MKPSCTPRDGQVVGAAVPFIPSSYPLSNAVSNAGAATLDKVLHGTFKQHDHARAYGTISK